MTGIKTTRRWQFSLRAVMLLLLAASIGSAALCNSNSAWASAAVTFTSLLLLASIVLAACSRGNRRAFWIGFAFCGWLYFIGVTTSVAPKVVRQLATTRLLEYCREKMHPASGYNFTTQVGGQPYQPPPPPVLLSDYADPDESGYEATAIHFLWIGQCVWVLIIAMLGGLLGHFAASRTGESQAASK